LKSESFLFRGILKQGAISTHRALQAFASKFSVAVTKFMSEAFQRNIEI